MFETGRMCVKIAGRDAGRKCIIVDVIDKNFVMIDGNVRRKKCNIRHLEPLNEVLKISKGASHDEVAAEFKKKKLEVWKTKPKEKSVKPKKQKAYKKPAQAAAEEKPKKTKKPKKKTEKKEAKKEVSEK